MGVLRRKSIDGNLQIIIPQKLTTKVLQMMHDDQGHFGYSMQNITASTKEVFLATNVFPN